MFCPILDIQEILTDSHKNEVIFFRKTGSKMAYSKKLSYSKSPIIKFFLKASSQLILCFYRNQKVTQKDVQNFLLLFLGFEANDGLSQKQKQDVQTFTHDLITIMARSLMRDLKKLEKYVSEISKGEKIDKFEGEERFISSLGLVQPIFGGGLFLVFLMGLLSMKFIIDIFILFIAWTLSVINPSFFDDPELLVYDNYEYG